MGLEYSTRPELNQYEAQNHAANIKMWLHDFVDGAIVPSIVSLENIFKAVDSYFNITPLGGINFKATAAYNWTSSHDDDFFDMQNNMEDLLVHNHDTAYSAITHDHDSAYAALTHDHDTAYAAKNKGLVFSYTAWVGNATARQINLQGDICHHPVMMYGLAVNDTIPVLHLIWWPSYGTYVRRYYYNSWFSVETAFGADPGSAEGFSSFNLVGTPINISGVSYLLWAYGPEGT